MEEIIKQYQDVMTLKKQSEAHAERVRKEHEERLKQQTELEERTKRQQEEKLRKQREIEELMTKQQEARKPTTLRDKASYSADLHVKALP